MLSVVCLKWGKRYTAEHVNVWGRMIGRNLSMPHRLVCMTDDAEGIEPGIDILPVPEKHAELGHCYRRLWLFSKEAGDVLGERFVSIDLDCVVTDCLDALFDRDEDFVVWKDAAARTAPDRFGYNGSMFLLRAGSRSHVWDNFDPVTSLRRIQAKRRCGSDQAILSEYLPDEATWTEKDGVLSFKLDCKSDSRNRPKGSRIVFFHGKPKPWDRWSGWISEHWR